MAETLKKLGESEPAAATATTLYDCQSAAGAAISVVTAANRSATPDKIRVGIDVGASGDTDSQWSYYDVGIGANETLELMRGATMADNDLLRVYSLNGDVAFNAFGVEVT